MKKELQTFSDGAYYFGDPRNKIIGPTPEDIKYFNSLSSDEKIRKFEDDLAKRELLPVSSKSRLGKLLNIALGKLPKKGLIFPTAAVLSVLSIAATCTLKDNGDKSPTPIVIIEEKSPTAPIRILPISGPVYLTQGEHAWDDSESGVKSSLDFAPKRVVDCPPGARITIDEQDVVATTSGTITAAGDPNDRNDPKHSIVEIKEDGTGVRFEEFHINDIPEKIKPGVHVERGDPIGKVSCEVPAGGRTTGAHVHEDVKDSEGNYIPINGFMFSDWVVDGNNMTKKDEKIRTADARRCSNDKICDGIRNDLRPDENTPAVTPTTAKQTPTPIFTATPIPPTPAPTLPSSLAAPSDLKIERLSDPSLPPYNQFKLTWRDNSDNEDEFTIVYHCSSPPPPNTAVRPTEKLPPNTISTIVTFNPNVLYVEDFCFDPSSSDRTACFAVDAENTEHVSRSEWECG